MATGTDAAGALLQEQVQRILIQPLETASVFLASGPRIFDTDGSPVRVPKLTGLDAPPSWHGENEQISEVHPAFNEVTLLPTTMASIKVVHRVSNELLRQSVIALDAALRDVLVRAVAAQIDLALIAGDGTPTGEGDDTPVGMLNWAGVQVIANVGLLTLDMLQDSLGLALESNLDVSRLRFFMTANQWTSIRKAKDADERFQLQPDPTVESAFRLFGVPVTLSGRIPTAPGSEETTIVLADMSTVAVARDLAPSVRILDQTWGDWDQIGIRVVARYDALPLLPDAVIRLEQVQPVDFVPEGS